MLVLIVANFLKGSLQDELDQIFQAIFKWDVARRFVSRSALSQARRKFSHTAFIELLDVVCRFVNEHAPLRKYHGRRVFAIDGSTFRLPNQTEFRVEFGTAANHNSRMAMGRISLLHDVLNRITYDGILASYHTGEFELAWRHLDESSLPPGSLFLMDRGYCDFKLFRGIVDQGHDFCVRLRSDFKIYKQFKASGLREQQLELKPGQSVRRTTDPNSSFRKKITVRLIRYTIDKTEYILMTTLLDTNTFPLLDLMGLYHQRWQVEESYKVKKCRMKIEDVSGSTPEIVWQDFHAKVFSESLTAAMMLAPAQETGPERGTEYRRLNERQAAFLPRSMPKRTSIDEQLRRKVKTQANEIPVQRESRTLNGSGNNIAHPDWGAAEVSTIRIFKNAYADGSDGCGCPACHCTYHSDLCDESKNL